MNRRCYLQECCNKYGDFWVAKSYKKDGVPMIGKWRSVLECWESDEGLNFLKVVDNRTVWPCEIVLDMDQNISIENLKRVCKILDKFPHTFPARKQYKVYFSGSKSYHIHYLDYFLPMRSKYQRERIREYLIKKTGCDVMLKGERHMIALEGVPHWKTGKLKKEIYVGP